MKANQQVSYILLFLSYQVHVHVLYLFTDPNLNAEVVAQSDGNVCISCTFTTTNTVGCVAVIYSNVERISVHSISKQPSEPNVETCFIIPFGTYTVAVFNRESNNGIALYPANITYVPEPTSSSRSSSRSFLPAVSGE